MDASQIAVARNSLMPYLDLFGRLEDAQLCILTGAPREVVADMRQRVQAVQNALSPRRTLLDELSDDELAGIVGADVRTIRFWRMTEQSPQARAKASWRTVQATKQPAQAQASASQSHPTMVQEDYSEEILIEDDEPGARDEEDSGDPSLGAALQQLMRQPAKPNAEQSTREPSASYPQIPQPVDAGISDMFRPIEY